MNALELKKRIQQEAKRLGFADCRIAKAKRAAHADEFQAWLEQGHHGEMAWMARTPERRCDPREVLEGCQSVICLAVNYFTGESPFQDEDVGNYEVARYAWNEDYHDWIEPRLKQLSDLMEQLGGKQRYYVDTGPVLERDFATDAGIGWNGKSCVQIHRHFGTWLFLAEILTTLELPEDQAFGDHCGKCTRCMTACPTQAIRAPHQLDSRRCISYLTIENKGAIPLEFRKQIGAKIYGCDVCLEVCPWNRFAQRSQESIFHARREIFMNKLEDFLYLEDEQFRQMFMKSPIKRIKRERFLRNVCVALGNTGTLDSLSALEHVMKDGSEMLKEHAQWAMDEIRSRAKL